MSGRAPGLVAIYRWRVKAASQEAFARKPAGGDASLAGLRRSGLAA